MAGISSAAGVSASPAAFHGGAVPAVAPITREDFDAFYEGYAARGDKVDVVVFSAPQLSLLDMEQVASLMDGRQVHPETTLMAVTSPEIKAASDRMGLCATRAA